MTTTPGPRLATSTGVRTNTRTAPLVYPFRTSSLGIQKTTEGKNIFCSRLKPSPPTLRVRQEERIKVVGHDTLTALPAAPRHGRQNIVPPGVQLRQIDTKRSGIRHPRDGSTGDRGTTTLPTKTVNRHVLGLTYGARDKPHTASRKQRRGRLKRK